MYQKYKHCTTINQFAEFHCIPLQTILGGSFCNCLPVADECDEWCGGELLNAISRSIQQAEQAIENIIGYSLCRRCETERVKYPRSKKPCANMKNTKCNWKSVELKKNRFIESGKCVEDFVANVPVRYIDEDGDGFREMGLIEFDIADFNPDELCLKYAGTDDKITPIESVDYDGTTLSIRVCWPELVDPKHLKPSKSPLPCQMVDFCCKFDDNDYPDGLIAGNKDCPFVPTVDLYHCYIDNRCDNARLVFNGKINTCSCMKCDVCKVSKYPACVMDTNICNMVRLVPVTIDEDGRCCESSCPTFHGEPEWVDIDYIGGSDDTPEELFDAVMYLAAAWMDYKTCGCSCELNQILDLKDTFDKNTSRVYTDSVPFATQNGKDYSNIVRLGAVGELRAYGIIRKHTNTRCHQK
ncbi:hypothetical protein N9137_01105 [Pseudomonadales bacterium]|nr:hypothetical protein [Pseudomonadales bacterium]